MKAIYGPLFELAMFYVFFIHNDGALFIQLVQYMTGQMTGVFNEAISGSVRP